MTLHIALVSESIVVQLGDRLLTVGGEPWDPTANKTIVVEASNGRAVIGYAGLAHISGEPTGEWLVRKITGSPASPIGFQFGGSAPLHLGQIRHRIVSGIEAEFAKSQPRGRRYSIELIVSGWGYPRVTRDSKRPTSFTYSMSHSGVPGARCRIVSTTRYRFRDPSRCWTLSAIGRGDLIDLGTINARLSSKNRTLNVDDVEAEIVSAIRTIGNSVESGVGRDIMSAYLPAFPWTVPPHIRYYRDTSVHDERVAYLPAFLAPGMISPAAQMNSSSGFQIVFNADTPDEWCYQTETVPKWTTPGTRRLNTQEGKRLR
ncbi:hypothetical protein [Leifsonia sp. 71-9]|uniref:hypothetical protein n=1 Tax=Leifsonia sp. 71-9 TaxID=1895934 RepID=UPI0025B917E4|nr:hypothetical protein [Leifsonia sp. 71-9]